MANHFASPEHKDPRASHELDATLPEGLTVDQVIENLEQDLDDPVSVEEPDVVAEPAVAPVVPPVVAPEADTQSIPVITSDAAPAPVVVPDAVAAPSVPPVAAPELEQVHVVTAAETGAAAEPRVSESLFASLAQDDQPEVVRTGQPTVSFREVSLMYKAQPQRPALDRVSLDIYPGEFIFVVGHSGSGKSSLLRLITRELQATSGQVIVAGHDLTRMKNKKIPYLRRQIGTVYQDFKLLPNKTVYENVAFALECIGKPKSVIKAQVPEVLRLVGLAERMHHFPDQLSGGEQQGGSVARAMVNRPPLLVCDEPTGNLDPAISLGIMKLLDRINRAGTTVVMATHDREMVDSMRKRVIALEAGQIVRDQEKGGYGFYGAL